MKKKEVKEKRESIWKNKKFLTSILGLFLIAIMIGSGLSMWGEDSETKTEYNGYKFTQTESGWMTYKDNQQIVILSSPDDVKNYTTTDIQLEDLYKYSKIYLVINPEERSQLELPVYEFFNNVYLAKNIVQACPEDHELCAKMPLKDCKDATSDTGVIKFKISDTTKVSFVNNCLVIQGKENEIDKITERLVLDLLL